MTINKRSIFGIILILILTVIAADTAFASYSGTVRKWTKTGRIYNFDTLDADLIWNATMLSDELIDAQLKLLAKKKVPQERPEISGVAFLLNLYTKKFLKDFSMSDKTTWRVYLVGADGIEVPASYINVSNLTPTQIVLFPHLNKWSKQYIVGFPSMDLGSEPKLIMRSVVAESTIKWDLVKLLSSKK